MTCRRLSTVLVSSTMVLAACSGHTCGYDIDAICRTAQLPATTPDDLAKIRDAIGAAAPDKLGDKPAGKPFKKFRLGIKLGTEAANATAPYSIPERLRPTDLPKVPDSAKVRQAQQELAKACQ